MIPVCPLLSAPLTFAFSCTSFAGSASFFPPLKSSTQVPRSGTTVNSPGLRYISRHWLMLRNSCSRPGRPVGPCYDSSSFSTCFLSHPFPLRFHLPVLPSLPLPLPYSHSSCLSSPYSSPSQGLSCSMTMLASMEVSVRA